MTVSVAYKARINKISHLDCVLSVVIRKDPRKLNYHRATPSYPILKGEKGSDQKWSSKNGYAKRTAGVI